MHWLTSNINHFVIPSTLILSISTMVFTYIGRKRRLQGKEPPYPKSFTFFMILLLVAGCILFGIDLAHNFG